MKSVLLLLAVTMGAMAQTPPAPPVRVSVAGTVKEKGTGKALANYTVSTFVNVTWLNNAVVMSDATKEVKSTTDETGRYKLTDLPAGNYRLRANGVSGPGLAVTRSITVGGRDLDNIDFNVTVEGTIKGRVLDENKEPVSGMWVTLIRREYFMGSMLYFFGGSAFTNDKGEYTLAGAESGVPYLIMTEPRNLRLPAHSDVPVDPELRRRIPMRTWYLNSPVKEGGVPVMLRSGEVREGVNIEVKKSQSYCVDGTLSELGVPRALSFTIEAQQPSSGISNNGGSYHATPSGTTGSDGKYRICDLYPGSYRLTVSEGSRQATSYAMTMLTIGDRDLNNFDVSTGARMDVQGEIVWEGAPPAMPPAVKVNFNLRPLLRTQLNGEQGGGRFDLPGPFSLTGMIMDSYAVLATINSPGLYVKDVTYAGRSVMYEPVRLGSAMGDAGLRVIVGQDGGTIAIKVADKDGNPIGDSHIAVMPTEVASEGVLSNRIVFGATNQAGTYTSPTLPPGKYYVAATDDVFDHSPDKIDLLWRSKNRFKEVELAPSGKAQADLQPVTF